MNWDPSSLSSLVFFSLVVENNNEPLGSLSYFTFFSSIVKDDDEPLGSLSYIGFFLKCRKRQWAGIPTHHCFWLFCFSCKRWQRAKRLVVNFYIFYFKCKRQQRTKRLIVISWFFFFKCKKQRQWAGIPAHHRLWLFCFNYVKVKTTTRKPMHRQILCTQRE